MSNRNHRYIYTYIYIVPDKCKVLYMAFKFIILQINFYCLHISVIFIRKECTNLATKLFSRKMLTYITEFLPRIKVIFYFKKVNTSFVLCTQYLRTSASRLYLVKILIILIALVLLNQHVNHDYIYFLYTHL